MGEGSIFGDYMRGSEGLEQHFKGFGNVAILEKIFFP
jgi:hypothetical protein